MIPSSLVFENFAVNIFTGITNLFEDSYFLLNGLWYFMSNFEDGITPVTSDCLTKVSSWTDNSIFTFSKATYPHLPTRLLPSDEEKHRPRLKGGQSLTVCSLRVQLLLRNCFCLSENRLIRISSLSEGLCRFLSFSCSAVWIVGVRNPPWGYLFFW